MIGFSSCYTEARLKSLKSYNYDSSCEEVKSIADFLNKSMVDGALIKKFIKEFGEPDKFYLMSEKNKFPDLIILNEESIKFKDFLSKQNSKNFKVLEYGKTKYYFFQNKLILLYNDRLCECNVAHEAYFSFKTNWFVE